ncbi:uncharacterized protein LOC125674581 isoform X2 [Ostrea edulis]|uniref:uncharacterized protein LOC125674581 isoform X2 n=1 Tax=Ostrea edulis TaxID=37623 RepID=UPI0024AF6D9E|nr:uncharacterized protein LOC125674581 isoform X2 [Ostrea edulis]
MEIPSVLLVIAVVVSSYKVGGKTSRMCLASVPTITHVSRCPTTEEEFRMAERRKSCVHIKQNCTGKTGFKYHCVINEYGNNSLEVCAPTWYISGFCTEYNVKGRVIQDHYRKDCTTFNKDPCPSRYLSTGSYKYSECFKNSLSSNLNSNLQQEGRISPTDNDKTFLIVDISLGMIVIIQIFVCILLIFRNRSRNDIREYVRQKLGWFKKDSKTTYDEHGSESLHRSYRGLESREEFTAQSRMDPERPLMPLPQNQIGVSSKQATAYIDHQGTKQEISTATACIDPPGTEEIPCSYQNDGGFVKKMKTFFDGNGRSDMNTQSEDNIYQIKAPRL